MKRELMIKSLRTLNNPDNFKQNRLVLPAQDTTFPVWKVVKLHEGGVAACLIEGRELITYEDVFPAPTETQGEASGGSCDYYKCPIRLETTEGLQDNLPDDVKYIAECNDIIEALDMTYAEANIFKEVWRSAAARTLGKKKAGHTEIRGAEKIVFFGKRNLIQKGGK